MITHLDIVLGSTSPRRKEILSILDVPFEVIPSEYEEDMSLQDRMSSHDLALFLSAGKGESVVHLLQQKKRTAIIIAADTFISFNDKCLGKPFTTEKQREMLTLFSGQEVEVITGIYVYNSYTGQIWNEAISSTLCFKQLTEEQIEWYTGTGEGLDRAGGFAMQGKGNVLIDHVRGDWYNMLGLPLSRMYDILQSCGVFVS